MTFLRTTSHRDPTARPAACRVLVMTKPLALLLVLGCGQHDRSDQPYQAQQRGDTLWLDQGPNAAATVQLREMTATVDVGSANTSFGAVADVLGLQHGFVVLDRMEDQLIWFDRGGSLVARRSRSGKGPGEFSDPWAMTRAGSRIVVWQNSPQQTFVMFDSAGQFVRTANQPARGDSRALIFRLPQSNFDTYQFGPEDITMRLSSWGTEGFVQLLGEDEMIATAEGRAINTAEPPIALLRYTALLQFADTLAVFRGAPLLRQSGVDHRLPEFAQPLFSSRPLVAGTATWAAIAHGDSAKITIVDTLLQPRLVVAWPHRRRSVMDDDIERVIEWVLEDANKKSQDWEKTYGSFSRARKAQINAYEKSRLIAADSIPNISAALASGSCVWISGHSAADNWNGVSATWMAIDVVNRRVAAVVRFPAGQKVRDIYNNFAYTTWTDEDGAWRVSQYHLDGGCEDPGNV